MNIFGYCQIFFAKISAVGGLEEAAKVSVLDSVLVSIVLALATVVIFLFRAYNQKNNQIVDIQDNHAIKLEDIREDMLKHEEDRNRQWAESEKETLNVLNGVSKVLEMSEKMNQIDTDKILSQVQNTEEKIINRIKILSKDIDNE